MDIEQVDAVASPGLRYSGFVSLVIAGITP